MYTQKILLPIAESLTRPNDGVVRRTGKISDRQEGFLGLFRVVSCSQDSRDGRFRVSQRDFGDPFPRPRCGVVPEKLSLSSAHACVTRTLASELEASARELKEKCAIHMQGK